MSSNCELGPQKFWDRIKKDSVLSTIPSTFQRITPNSVLIDPGVAVRTPGTRSLRLRAHLDSASQELFPLEHYWCRSSTALVERVSTKTRTLVLEWVRPCRANHQELDTPVFRRTSDSRSLTALIAKVATKKTISLGFSYPLAAPNKQCARPRLDSARLGVGLAIQSQLQTTVDHASSLPYE